jgi:hypothetical protein
VRDQREQAHLRALRGVRVERAAVPARLQPLRHHGVGPGLLRGERLVEGGGAGEPGHAGVVQPPHVLRPEQAHDRRRRGRSGGEDRLALRIEVRCRRPGPAGRPEPRQGVAGRRHAGGVVDGRVGHPHVELQRAARQRVELLGPARDPLRRVQHDPGRAHAPAPATAAARAGGHAPAIGAMSTGTRSPNRSQNSRDRIRPPCHPALVQLQPARAARRRAARISWCCASERRGSGPRPAPAAILPPCPTTPCSRASSPPPTPRPATSPCGCTSRSCSWSATGCRRRWRTARPPWATSPGTPAPWRCCSGSPRSSPGPSGRSTRGRSTGTGPSSSSGRRCRCSSSRPPSSRTSSGPPCGWPTSAGWSTSSSAWSWRSSARCATPSWRGPSARGPAAGC